MKLSILITTMNSEIDVVLKELVPQIKKSEIIISHQITDGSKPLKNIPKNIKYYYMFEKGLSKNRNNALKYATGDICLICDDDLRFPNGFEDKIIRSYINRPNADVITFRTLLPNLKLRKKYPNKEFHHSKLSALSVTSHEITFKRKSLIKNKINFNENFGLGSEKYVAGEENLFIVDCLKRDLNVLFVPKSIDIHPRHSSGLDYSESRIRCNVAIFRVMFGKFLAFFFIFYFLIFHHKLYKKKFSFFEFLKISLNEYFVLK